MWDVIIRWIWCLRMHEKKRWILSEKRWIPSKNQIKGDAEARGDH